LALGTDSPKGSKKLNLSKIHDFEQAAKLSALKRSIGDSLGIGKHL